MSYLVTEDLDIKINDTVVRYQEFYDYYAYDDGSSENGYGLNGEGTANASVACRFETFNRDTLRAVSFYFNRTLGDYTQDFFRLAVWNHDPVLDGPGELIRSLTGFKPEYRSQLNEFVTYGLDSVIVVSDIFYVGWIKTTERLLNVGWDRWNNNQDKIFYNLGQGWVNTKFDGSLMIRPVMGRELAWPVPVPETNYSGQLPLQLYPNPARDYFYLELPPDAGRGNWSVSLFNLQGRLVYRSPENPVMNFYGNNSHFIGDLPEGMYIVKVDRDGIGRANSKLMIVR
jgi:hypothetical protein